MGLLLLTRNIRELWKEWELRLLILLSLFLQLTHASQGRKRRSISRNWIQFVVWMTYLLADSIAILTLGVLSNHLANIKEMKGTFDPKSQITAFWAPFLPLHLGGPDTITAFALADDELRLRQLGAVLRPARASVLHLLHALLGVYTIHIGGVYDPRREDIVYVLGEPLSTSRFNATVPNLCDILKFDHIPDVMK